MDGVYCVLLFEVGDVLNWNLKAKGSFADGRVCLCVGAERADFLLSVVSSRRDLFKSIVAERFTR